MARRAPKGTPTALNIHALARAFADAPGGVIRYLDAVTIPHVRRCLHAGLLDSAGERGAWVLSPAGREAIAAAALEWPPTREDWARFLRAEMDRLVAMPSANDVTYARGGV